MGQLDKLHRFAHMMPTYVGIVMGPVAVGFAQAPVKSRLAQRVRMQEVQMVSPDGGEVFCLANAERLTYAMRPGGTTVIEASPLVMNLDGCDLSCGVVFNTLERYEVNETYSGYRAQSTAVSQSNGGFVVHDLSLTTYTLKVRVFNNGACRTNIGASIFRVTLPFGTAGWRMGIIRPRTFGRTSQKFKRETGPPLTFKLLSDGRYASITEANLVNYSGMGLEAGGRRGWVVGLGHRHPLN